MFKDDLHAALISGGLTDPFGVLKTLRLWGLSNELVWLVFGHVINVDFAAFGAGVAAQGLVATRKRRELIAHLKALRHAAGLGAVRLPQFSDIWHTPRDLLRMTVVRALFYGPEREDDRRREAERLRHLGCVVQERAASGSKFRCCLCKRFHGRRASVRCLSRNMLAIDGVLQRQPTTRAQMMSLLAI